MNKRQERVEFEARTMPILTMTMFFLWPGECASNCSTPKISTWVFSEHGPLPLKWSFIGENDDE
jgi:hypothetical protein